MKLTVVLSLAVLGALAGVTLAHEDNPPNPPNSDPPGSAILVPNWRDNYIPYFTAGDPKTRHDSDPSNDQSRDNPDTRHSMQRWRDETTTGGDVKQVGDGCMYGSCLAVADQDGDLVRADATASLFTDGDFPLSPLGGGAREGDPNAVNVQVLGAGAQADFGGAKDLGVPGQPTYSLPDHLTDPTITTETDPHVGAPPDEISVAYSADHSLGGWAHSPGGHGNGEFDQHDTHGGTMSLDVYLPTQDDPTRFRNSKYGLVILDHLDCYPVGCFDEYHNFYPADPERTIYQVGEMPGQTETVARDPDRWLWGKDSGFHPLLTPQVGPAAGSAFGQVDPILNPAVSSTTGVGTAQSACCVGDPGHGGKFCDRNAGNIPFTVIGNQAVAGCVEIDANNCFGGAANATGTKGCMVVNGQATVDGQPASPKECTAAAVDACCESGNCI